MHGQWRYTALGCMPIGLHKHISSAKEIANLVFWDEFIEQYYLILELIRPDEMGVFDWILIKLTSNDQFVSALFDARISHGF